MARIVRRPTYGMAEAGVGPALGRPGCGLLLQFFTVLANQRFNRREIIRLRRADGDDDPDQHENRDCNQKKTSGWRGTPRSASLDPLANRAESLRATLGTIASGASKVIAAIQTAIAAKSATPRQELPGQDQRHGDRRAYFKAQQRACDRAKVD